METGGRAVSEHHAPPVQNRRLNQLGLLESFAGREGGGRIDGAITLLDAADLSFLVDHERDTAGHAAVLDEDAVGLRNFTLEVTEEGKLDAVLGGEFFLRGEGVDADTQDLGVGRPELCEVVPVALDFARSPAGEGEDVEREHHVLLAAEVRQLDLLAVLIDEREIRRRVPDLEMGLGRRGLLRVRGDEARHYEQNQPESDRP